MKLLKILVMDSVEAVSLISLKMVFSCVNSPLEKYTTKIEN